MDRNFFIRNFYRGRSDLFGLKFLGGRRNGSDLLELKFLAGSMAD